MKKIILTSFIGGIHAYFYILQYYIFSQKNIFFFIRIYYYVVRHDKCNILYVVCEYHSFRMKTIPLLSFEIEMLIQRLHSLRCYIPNLYWIPFPKCSKRQGLISFLLCISFCLHNFSLSCFVIQMLICVMFLVISKANKKILLS